MSTLAQASSLLTVGAVCRILEATGKLTGERKKKKERERKIMYSIERTERTSPLWKRRKKLDIHRNDGGRIKTREKIEELSPNGILLIAQQGARGCGLKS